MLGFISNINTPIGLGMMTKLKDLFHRQYLPWHGIFQNFLTLVVMIVQISPWNIFHVCLKYMLMHVLDIDYGYFLGRSKKFPLEMFSTVPTPKELYCMKIGNKGERLTKTFLPFFNLFYQLVIHMNCFSLFFSSTL